MKKYYTYLTIALLVLFTALGNVGFAQKAFYFGPDASVNVNDTIVLQLKDYVGEQIQWQRSFDKIKWEDIPGANEDVLEFEADTTSFFRARVIAGDCDPFYSDNTLVGVYKLTEDIKLIDKDQTILISDSLELANGIYRFYGEPVSVDIGSVILGQQDEGFMRIVIGIQQEQDELILETTQANMEDVFNDFALQDSLVITLNDNKTNMFGGRPLPVEVLYLPPGASLKKNGSGIDFSNDTIYHDDFISVIMDAGTVNFEPIIYREFDYKRILGIPTKLRSMKLTAGGMMEASMGVKVLSTQQTSYEYSVLIGQFGVAVPVGPVPVVIVLSFYLGFDANMELQIYATAGFESNYKVAFGAEYHRDEQPQWQEVWEEESNFTYTSPSFSTEGLVEAKAYVKPELAISITGLAGPTFAVDPYLRFKGELDFPEWYWEIAAGIGGYLGFQVGLFGYYILDYYTDLFNFDYILASGTSYLDDEPGLPCPGLASFTDTRDGNVYHTVLVGDQCWMKGNLAWLPQVGPPAGYTDLGELPPRYFVNGYFGNNVDEAKQTANYQNYGVLYNQLAAQTACPTGWSLPEKVDWENLISFLGGETIAGGKMKSTRTEPEPHPRWNSPNAGATNESGFSALPGGDMFLNVIDWEYEFNPVGLANSYWSSTIADEYQHQYHCVLLGASLSSVFLTGFENTAGFSIRCIKE